MTDCHPTLPESLIMQAEALHAKHSKHRKDGPLALEFVSLEGGGEKEGKAAVTGFFPHHFQSTDHCFLPLNKQQESARNFFGLLFYHLHYNTAFIPSPLFFFLEGGREIRCSITVPINTCTYLWLKMTRTFTGIDIDMGNNQNNCRTVNLRKHTLNCATLLQGSVMITKPAFSEVVTKVTRFQSRANWHMTNELC